MKSPADVIGWREWLALPQLGVRAIKAKIDTGARSSTLHAFDVEIFRREGVSMVRFKIHPLQRTAEGVVAAEAPLLDQRWVRTSSGHENLRPVIATDVRLGEHRWTIELTLTNRDAMGFRMLIGRQALRKRFCVDAGRAYVLGKRPSFVRRKKRKEQSP